MILRLAAALALLAGAAVFMGYLYAIGKGPLAPPAARHLRAMKERTEPPPSVTPVSYEYFRALPHHAPPDSVAAIERRGVSIEGWVQRILRATDGDIHLEVAPVFHPPEQPVGAYATAEITPHVRGGSTTWTYEGLARAFRVNVGAITPWEQGPRRARIGGWLLFDYQYDLAPDSARIERGVVRMTGWEIHPVTHIELWDDSLHRYVEFAR